MIRVEETRRNDVRIPFLVTRTSADQVAPKTEIRNPESGRHTPVRELNLTGSELVVGGICFLTAMELVLWAVLKLWLFAP